MDEKLILQNQVAIMRILRDMNSTTTTERIALNKQIRVTELRIGLL